MKVFNKEKFVKYLNEIIEENNKHIENNNDGDNHCMLENETMENIIYFMSQSKFYDEINNDTCSQCGCNEFLCGHNKKG